jgi:hypothetical protein
MYRAQLSSAANAFAAARQTVTNDPQVALERSTAWAAGLSSADTSIIKEWTGIGHRSMRPEAQEQLLNAIQTAPEYNGRAYRIVVEGSAGNGCLRSATMGDCFDLKLFYHYEKRALRPRVIEIDLTEAPGKAIAGASNVPREREVLLGPEVTLEHADSKKRWGRYINCYTASKSVYETTETSES